MVCMNKVMACWSSCDSFCRLIACGFVALSVAIIRFNAKRAVIVYIKKRVSLEFGCVVQTVNQVTVYSYLLSVKNSSSGLRP